MLDRNVNRNSPSDRSSCHAPPESKSMRPPHSAGRVGPARADVDVSPAMIRAKTIRAIRLAPDARRGSSETTRNVMSPIDRKVSNGGALKSRSLYPGGHDVGALQREGIVQRCCAGPRRARRLAAAEDRFVGPQRNFLDLRLVVGLFLVRLLVPVVSSIVFNSSSTSDINAWPHDPQPEAAGALTTRRNRLPSFAIVGGG